MVYHVVGRLGAGKSMWAVSKILDALVYTDKVILTNVRLIDFWDYYLAKYMIKGLKSFTKFVFFSPFSSIKEYMLYLSRCYSGRYIYMSDLDQAVAKGFEMGEAEESSRLFVWDEIHLDLNAREWKRTSGEMIKFFAMSRKLGFDVIMITQIRTALDRQMRDLADIAYELKNIKHYKPFGIRLFPNVGILTKRWANRGFESDKGVFVGMGIVRYKSYIKDFYKTGQLLTHKDLPSPVLWSERHKTNDFCSDCVYKKYYIKYDDFIKLYYPEAMVYKSALPYRLMFDHSDKKSQGDRQRRSSEAPCPVPSLGV